RRALERGDQHEAEQDDRRGFGAGSAADGALAQKDVRARRLCDRGSKTSINAITGHKLGDVSEEHYLMLKDDVALLKRHLDQIDFPFLRQVCAPIAA
ncbi:hypothetical protein, partial [Bosea minatitlanensis]